MRSTNRNRILTWVLGLTLMAGGGASAQAPEMAVMTAAPGAVHFEALGDHGALVLRVTGPEGLVLSRQIDAGGVDLVQTTGLPDGTYSYELRPVVELAPEVAEVARAAREAGDEATLRALRAAGDLPEAGLVQSGAFTVLNGAVLPGDLIEEEGLGPAAITREGATGGNVLNTLDQVILDDLIVDGSACIGFDCVNGEAFGFDTLRLKENNLRIKFDDTSLNNFPANDWQLTANDSANGGLSKFSIDDISGARTPFTIEARAPSHSLYVDDGGRLGLGTSIPVADVHVVSGNSPTLRLEQNGSSGFAPQTWDVVGNETNFFVRDASNGSTLPLRIRPGAPSSTVYIDTDGDVGFSTSGPASALHVRRTNNTATVRVEDLGNSAQDLLQLVNNGVVRFRMHATDSNNEWQFRVGPNGFNFTKDGTGGNEFEVLNNGTVNMGPGGSAVFSLAPNGNLAIDGTLSEGSDRNSKHDIQPVDRNAILERVSQLPLSTWRYIKDESQAQHLGPMAQDFSALFGLGSSDKRIGVLDMSGVALASIQALNEKLTAKQEELEDLRSENEALKARNDSFEARLAALEAAQQK